MSTWHGHTQAPDAVDGRPWWVNVHHPDEHGPTVVMRGFGDTASLLQRKDMAGPGQAEALYEAMDAYDLAHPREVPAPACGQIWVWPDVGCQRTVIAVEPSVALVVVFGGSMPGVAVDADGVPSWPPWSAVLVSGMGAPWAGV